MQKRIILLIIVVGILLSCLFGVYSFYQEIYRKKLPEISRIGKFSLVNSDGKEFSSEHLVGRVWIADFIFTTCSDICPVMSKNMSSLDRTFKMLKNITLVSITVNPEYDTPEVLADYAKQFRGDHQRWYFLTGKREEIRHLLINNFKLGAIEEPIFHSPHFTLVDRRGYIRGYYDGTNKEDINRLFKDAAVLLRER